MHFCVACVALGDIQSAFACVANMAPAFLVARLGAVDVAAAAALTSTLLWFTVTTDVTHCVVRLASSCPLVWAPLSPLLAPLSALESLSLAPTHLFGSRRGADIHAAVARQAWHRWHYVFADMAPGDICLSFVARFAI